MKKNKGFTLIELLAVIVILAVIALIATPIIMNVINDAKMGAFKDTAHGILKAGELKVTKEQTATNVYAGEIIDVTGNTLDYKGTKPNAGALLIQADGKMALEMNDGTYCAMKTTSESEVTIKKKGNSACDGTGINANFSSTISMPELKNGMIAITFDASGNTIKADTNTKWYDYDAKKWANAVSVTSSARSKYQSVNPGTKVDEADILGYFVWIPRYRYQLWNAENGTAPEQEIKIEFEKSGTTKSIGTKNGQWLTHPAFTFGSSELSGIWVGKFEMTGTGANPTVKPNQKSLTNQNNATAFQTIQKLSTTDTYGLAGYDSHMMKNSEWGAVAYLSHSKYGKNGEIWINNVNTNSSTEGPSITGCAGTSASARAMNNMTTCETGRDYKNAGVNASTTGNISGVYDMSGGTWDRVMGVLVDVNGSPIYSDSGFTAETMPDKKYYDAYTMTSGIYDYNKGHLGDATREIIKGTAGGAAGWYADYSVMSVSSRSWLARSGTSIQEISAGAFHFDSSPGFAWSGSGSRAVIVAE